MAAIRQLLKEKYHLSNYQIAQLAFLTKTFLSEISKMLIMGIIFHKQLPLYFFTLFVMLILRCSTGGLHFYTYAGCLTASIVYIGLAIVLLPTITLPLNMKTLLMLICIIVCYYVGPISSKYRPAYSKNFAKKCKYITSYFIFIYALVLYIIPESSFFISGFWIIILHSLQLLIAKYTRKEPLE